MVAFEEHLPSLALSLVLMLWPMGLHCTFSRRAAGKKSYIDTERENVLESLMKCDGSIRLKPQEKEVDDAVCKKIHCPPRERQTDMYR